MILEPMMNDNNNDLRIEQIWPERDSGNNNKNENTNNRKTRERRNEIRNNDGDHYRNPNDGW